MEPRICIIGAGCSGLAAIKAMKDKGLDQVVCFEQNPWIGGNWKYTADESHSSVCSTTHIISSKTLSEFSDFPMPADYPDYPSHQQVLAYFEAYADKFKLKEHIHFNTRVEKVSKESDGSWNVKTSNGKDGIFDYLLVANGHHSEPNHPRFASDFKGRYLHSHSFKNNIGFEDQRVLVIGAGNSACDCAVEISRVAKEVDISLRTPHIVPKFFLGKPSDSFNKGLLWIPRSIRNILLKISLRLQLGKYSDYGLPEPKHGVLEAHPTMNSELLYFIRHGKIQPRSGVEKIEGKKVWFRDDTVKEYDVLLAATGYKIYTAFFEKDFLDYSDSDRVELYLRMIHPEHKGLFFIGLFQPQGAIWPGSELQSKIVARHITGEWSLPENLKSLAKKETDRIERSYLKRKRHSIEVDYHEFMAELRAEL